MTASANDPNGVCAVVTTYFPDPALRSRLASLSAQVDRVLVVDNGTTGPAAASVAAAGTLRGVALMGGPENIGVAAALNRGAEAALSHGCGWVLLMDQDSEPSSGMVAALRGCWNSFPSGDRPMVLGPRTAGEAEVYSADRGPACAYEEVSHVITSGSLIPARAFQEVGGFLEGLYIDYVDIEFCLRIRSRGFRVVRVRDAVLRHRLGRMHPRRLLGRTVHPSHHDAVRRYYQFRNAMLVHRRYGRGEPGWRRNDRTMLLKIACLMILCEDRRLEKCRYALRGMLHGIRGRAGRRGERELEKTPPRLGAGG